MANVKLTKRSVETLQPEAKDKLWWDSELRGFGVKVTRAGTKIFVLQYRMGGRGVSTRRFTIGKLGSPWDALGARKEAERLLRQVAEGTDPQRAEKERQRQETELEFSAYAERFITEYGERHWRRRTLQSRSADLRRWVIPVLRTRSLTTITRRDLAQVFDRLPAGRAALPRNVFVVTRKLFSWAQQRGDVDRSPCEGMKSPRAVASRDRVLDDEELMMVAALALYLGEPFGSFIHLLLLTGQRRNEVASLTWDELDRGRREWNIPAERAKNHRAHLVPLGELAVISLDKVAGSEKWPRKGFVFSTTGSTPISGFSRAKGRLDRLLSEMADHRVFADWRLHDLRRTMATNLQRLGVRFEVTEALLNHVGSARGGVAGVYQRHDWHDEKRQAVDLWDAKLRGAIDEFTVRVKAAFHDTSNEPRIGHKVRGGRAEPVLIPPPPQG